MWAVTKTGGKGPLTKLRLGAVYYCEVWGFGLPRQAVGGYLWRDRCSGCREPLASALLTFTVRFGLAKPPTAGSASVWSSHTRLYGLPSSASEFQGGFDRPSRRHDGRRPLQAVVGDGRIRAIRGLENARLDSLQSALWDAAMAGDVKAVHSIVQSEQARVRLNGLEPARDVRGGTPGTPRTVVVYPT